MSLENQLAYPVSEVQNSGLTVRQYAVLLAMQGLLANSTVVSGTPITESEAASISEAAQTVADKVISDLSP